MTVARAENESMIIGSHLNPPYIKKNRAYNQKLVTILSNKKTIVIFAFILLAGILFLRPHTASAESRVNRVKTVAVIEIAEGDTVWGIAEQYYTDGCGKFTDYVKEIKRSNNLMNDIIYAGNYLIIPYYIYD